MEIEESTCAYILRRQEKSRKRHLLDRTSETTRLARDLNQSKESRDRMYEEAHRLNQLAEEIPHRV
jgi:hypothetical protein